MSIINTKARVNQSLLNEIEQIKIGSAYSNGIRSFLHFLLKSSSSKKKFKTNSMYLIKKLDHKMAKTLYEKAIENKLKSQSNFSYPTFYEHRLVKQLKRMTKQKILTSFHADIYCADIFIPNLALAIEVDGGIHLNELKMKKDNFKERYFQKHGVQVARCPNEDISKFVISFSNLLYDSKKVPYKRRRNILNSFYIDTICKYLSKNEIIESLGDHLDSVYLEYLEWNRKRKRLKKSLNKLNNINNSSLTSKYSGNEGSVISSREKTWKN